MKIYDDEDGKRTLKEEENISYLPAPRTLHEVQFCMKMEWQSFLFTEARHHRDVEINFGSKWREVTIL
jgi:hypothetical protein